MGKNLRACAGVTSGPRYHEMERLKRIFDCQNRDRLLERHDGFQNAKASL